MSKADKQQYLRESILNDNMDTESFIMFMEQDKDKGADLDRYEMDELKKKVKEFKDNFPARHGLDEEESGDLLRGAKLPQDDKPKQSKEAQKPKKDQPKPKPVEAQSSASKGQTLKPSDAKKSEINELKLDDDEDDDGNNQEKNDDGDKGSKVSLKKDCQKL